MMSAQYSPKAIEKMAESLGGRRAFKASDRYDKPKYYCLIEFPYPSGAGLHVGHPPATRAGYHRPQAAHGRL